MNSQHCHCGCGWRLAAAQTQWAQPERKKDALSVRVWRKRESCAASKQTRSRRKRRAWGREHKWNSNRATERYFCILILLLGTWHLARKKTFPEILWLAVQWNQKFFLYLWRIFRRNSQTRLGSSVGERFPMAVWGQVLARDFPSTN